MTTIDASLRALEIQGSTVPKLGFGTWEILGRDCEEAVADALEIGYRHIDTAQAYENESEVGKGLAAGGVPRNELFLTTKLWRDQFAADRVRPSAEGSLERLQVEYVDLLLLHWPNADVPLEETLGALAELREAGLVRHYGVSNVPAGMLSEALQLAAIFADQVEFHPFLGQQKLVDLAVEKDFMVTAYSPLARGRVPKDETLRAIGDAYGKTAGQVALRWLLDQPNVATIPKASSHERRVENFEVFDFELSDEDRAKIDALPKDERVIDPRWAPDWDA
jgi:2,5-diketo-D-gluconate reductase B